MFKLLNAHHTLETLINYKRAQAVVRKTIRSAKHIYLRQFCNTIGRETQLSDIWRTIRKMSVIRKNVEIPVLCSNNKNAISNAGEKKLFGKSIVKIHSSGNLSSTAKQYRDQTLAQSRDNREKHYIRGRSGSAIYSICVGKSYIKYATNHTRKRWYMLLHVRPYERCHT